MSGEKLLVVDDDSALRGLLSDFLEQEGYQVVQARDGRTALATLDKEQPAAVLLDVRLPDIDGLTLLKRMQDEGYEQPVIVMTAYGTATIAIESMKLGAYDYVLKPFELEEVRLTLQRMLEHYALTARVQALEEQLGDRNLRDRIVGSSLVMQNIFKTVGRVAASDATVLIIGETGTGKELIAQTIHENSARAKGPLVKVNCAALPETLLESELFGHEKGSFTGATERRSGRFELADKGTIFLDEIGEMTLSTQKKFLRVLQEGEFQRVGGNTTLKVDVRVIAATNKDLPREIETQRFREDLYYRLNVISLHLPPLHQRLEDIPLLVAHFLDKYRYRPGYPPTKITDEALAKLQAYDWPGNVRELENVIERAVILSGGQVITPDHLSLGEVSLRVATIDLAEHLRQRSPLQQVLAEAERSYIEATLREVEGQREEAAQRLGLSPEDLEQRLAQYRLAE